jgi:uncharacterized cupin superfamily protein
MKRPLVVHVVEGDATLRIEGGRFGIVVRPGDTLTIKNPVEWTLTHDVGPGDSETDARLSAVGLPPMPHPEEDA